MRDRPGRLGQEQARLGPDRRQPTLTQVAGQALVIRLGVVAEQREVEAVLPVPPAVAAAGVAARAGQDRARCPGRSPRDWRATLLTAMSASATTGAFLA